MRPFAFARASDEGAAIRLGSRPAAAFIAGGTTLVDLMRIGVMAPESVVDIGALPLRTIETTAGGLRIGALATNAAVAADRTVLERFPALAQALLAGASPQVRNMASVGGNLLQRTRCPYFRDVASGCNKRQPGSGCSAKGGYDRSHAILGTSDACIATHASDMCVALAALDASIGVRGPNGSRTVPMADLHVLPGDHPERESVLAAGEIVTHVELAAAPLYARSHYVKVRDRASFAFALASAAVALSVEEGVIRDARVAVGGVATKPWRSHEAERELIGKPAAEASYSAAAKALVTGAVPGRYNAFKVELVQRTLVRALAGAARLK